MKHVTAPCPACPFARSVEPGALGGSLPTTYIGQAEGAFVLPCHQACDFDDPQWKDKVVNTPQCAGAAIYRANIGAATRLPPAIHSLPADTEKVFATPAEFLAHHMGITVEKAQIALSLCPPEFWLEREMAQAGVKVYWRLT